MKNKGFTLIEVLVTALIASIAIGGIMYFIAMSNRVMIKSTNEARAQSATLFVMNKIGNDVKAGALIESKGDNGFLISSPDGTPMFLWGMPGGKAYRRDYINGSGGYILIPGLPDHWIKGTFRHILNGGFDGVELNLSLKAIDANGNYFASDSLSNAYYCRVDKSDL
ncbi:MAG: prepilin-type N-terminal cleavage/methylation domain-containing protein [Candidatus Delongbacteria bacterium]|nr:prepilin-type N-terminal cleavage/methylation domain-containing protein [Candidatus Delongbacteria bacterium]